MAKIEISKEVLLKWAEKNPALAIHKENIPLLKVMYFEQHVATNVEEWQDGAKIAINVMISAYYEKMLTLCKVCYKKLDKCNCGLREEKEFDADSYGAVAVDYVGEDSDVASMNVQFSPFRKGVRPRLVVGSQYKILGVMSTFVGKDANTKAEKAYRQIQIEEYEEIKTGYNLKSVDEQAKIDGTIPLDVAEGVKQLLELHGEAGKIPIAHFNSAVGKFKELALSTYHLKVDGEFIVEDVVTNAS